MKETRVDQNTGYFLVRNIVAHEPMHDFNPSGCISRIKKLNKRLIKHTSGGNNSQKGGDYQSWDSSHNLLDIDDNFVNSDFKYFNDETCFDDDGKQINTNFNVSKILTSESEDGLIQTEINAYINQVIILNETHATTTRNITRAEKETISDEREERKEQLAGLPHAVGHGDGLGAEEEAEAEGEINIAPYGVQDYDSIIEQIRTQFRQGDVAGRTRSKTIELDNNVNTIIQDCQYIVDISDYFRVLFVSFFDFNNIPEGGGAAVVSTQQSVKITEPVKNIKKANFDLSVKSRNPVVTLPVNTKEVHIEEIPDDLLVSPFENQYIEMIEILNFLKHKNGWLKLDDIDNDQLSDDEIYILKKDIIKIIEFYLELFEYYIGEINNKNSVFEINNSNFIRNGLFLFFLNKLTDEHPLPNGKVFYNDIFEIGRTNISDEESDLLYKLRNFPSNENGQSGGSKTLYKKFATVFKEYENNATLMTNIHIKSLAEKLKETEIDSQQNKEQYILDQLKLLGTDDDIIDDYFKNLLTTTGEDSYFHTPDDGALALADDVNNPQNFYNNKVIKAICYMIILVGMGGRTNKKYLDYINEAEALFINILQKTIEMSVNNITKIFNDNVEDEDEDLKQEWTNFIPKALTDIFNVIINLNISSRSIFGRSNMNNEKQRSYKCKVINELNNKIFYKFHKKFMSMNSDKKLVGQLKAVKLSKSAQGTAETKLFTNNLLVAVCSHINNLFSNDNPDIGVYTYQKNLLKNVSKQKKIPSDVDTKLLNAFAEEYNNTNSFEYIDDANFDDDIKDKLRVESQKVHIINNAITSKIGLDKNVQITKDNKNDLNQSGSRKEIIGHMEDDEANFKIFCPITSKLDAMGSFGSCNNATPNEQPSPSNIMNVLITTPKSDENLNFEYGFKLSKSKRDVFILEYYIRAEGDNDNIFFISGLVEQNIKDSGSNIKLSAHNTFERVLDKIESNYVYLFEGLNTDSKYINYDTILAESDTNDIIGSLSNKSAGDIGQELSAIIKDGGYNTTAAADTEFRTLGQGDRPSFVRASIIAIKSRNTTTNDINKDTSIFYSTESKSGSAFKTSVYITKDKTPTGGAKNKIKKRKVKKNKIKKNKTKKNKKNKKIKLKKSKKYINKLSKNKKTTIKKRKKQNKVKRKSIKK